eukprot:scaffold117769_cov63-Phaeocystis_antarctica.AAC.3
MAISVSRPDRSRRRRATRGGGGVSLLPRAAPRRTPRRRHPPARRAVRCAGKAKLAVLAAAERAALSLSCCPGASL